MISGLFLNLAEDFGYFIFKSNRDDLFSVYIFHSAVIHFKIIGNVANKWSKSSLQGNNSYKNSSNSFA